MNKPLSILSLRLLMLVLVGLLGTVALLFAARDLVQSREISREVHFLVRQNGIADHGLHALQDFAFERGRSNVVLRGEGAIGADNRALISDFRVSADRSIAAVLAELPEGMGAQRGVAARLGEGEVAAPGTGQGFCPAAWRSCAATRGRMARCGQYTDDGNRIDHDRSCSGVCRD